jgi:hypothetical protein
MTKLKLPEPIAAYFQADAHAGEAITHCFTEQAGSKTRDGPTPARQP